MTRFNLNLLASLCENNNPANNRIGGQTPKSMSSNLNNNDSLTPNHNLIGQTSAVVENNPMTSSFLKTSPVSSNRQNSACIQSSTLNTSMLEQLDQLPDFGFNENLTNTKGAATNPTNSSFNLSKTPSDRGLNDSSITTSNELNAIGRVSSLASPASTDHQPSLERSSHERLSHDRSSLSTPNQNQQSKNGKTTMAIRCKFGHLGSNKGQFSSPHGFCLGAEEEIVIADTYNHRICVFNKNGEFLYQFGLAGKEDGQLWHPRKVSNQRSSSELSPNLGVSLYLIVLVSNLKSPGGGYQNTSGQSGRATEVCGLRSR